MTPIDGRKRGDPGTPTLPDAAISRRVLLRSGVVGLTAVTTAACGLVAGCGPGGAPREGGGRDASPTEDGDAWPPAARDAAVDAGSHDAPDALVPTPECLETEDNILGPYYRAGAPQRADLVDARMPGTRLAVSGRVFSFGDECTVALGGALLDVWQANDEGRYDDSAGAVRPDPFVLRGRLYTDASGSYEFRTIVPGRYLNGAQYRPAHIHVQLSAPGHRTLTTQLYFAGDPFNDVDSFIRRSLIMTLSDAPDGSKRARFDFVLRPV